MTDQPSRSRWRFSLKSVGFVIFVLCAFLAANLSAGKPQVMFRFAEEDGGTAVYGTSYGWPLPYLRVPTGDHDHMPADLFMPGLMVDVSVIALMVAAILFLPRVLSRLLPHQSRQVAEA